MLKKKHVICGFNYWAFFSGPTLHALLNWFVDFVFISIKLSKRPLTFFPLAYKWRRFNRLRWKAFISFDMMETWNEELKILAKFFFLFYRQKQIFSTNKVAIFDFIFKNSNNFILCEPIKYCLDFLDAEKISFVYLFFFQT